MENFEEICLQYFQHGWEQYRHSVPEVVISSAVTDEYIRIPLHSGACQVVLMCWGPGATTAIHDHAGARGRVKILKGSLAEKRYVFQDSKLELISSGTTQPGEVVEVAATDLHSVRNPGKEVAVSLHIYDTMSDSLEGTRLFDEELKRMGVLNRNARRSSWREPPEAFASVTKFGSRT